MPNDDQLINVGANAAGIVASRGRKTKRWELSKLDQGANVAN